MAIIPHPVQGNRLADELPGIYSRREFIYKDFRGQEPKFVNRSPLEQHLLISKEEIDEAVSALADRFFHDLEERGIDEIVAICCLNGAKPFFDDITKILIERHGLKITKLNFYAPSYENDKHTGRYEIKKDIPEGSITGKVAVKIEDICDTGNSAYYGVTHLARQKPKELIFMTMLDKPEGRKNSSLELQGIKANYTAFLIGNYFVYGKGLDLFGYEKETRDLDEVFSKE